jgi:putative transposase
MDILKYISRTDPAVIAYGLYLYFSSRSYRFASKSLEPIIKRTLVAETLLKVNGQAYWLWIAYEPNTKSCLMIHLSREKTIFVCYRFLKQLRTKYGIKPISTDGALWYSDACKWLRLKHFVYKIEMKNLMERFIQQVKDRTECFDDHFPCRIKDCDDSI